MPPIPTQGKSYISSIPANSSSTFQVVEGAYYSFYTSADPTRALTLIYQNMSGVSVTRDVASDSPIDFSIMPGTQLTVENTKAGAALAAYTLAYHITPGA